MIALEIAFTALVLLVATAIVAGLALAGRRAGARDGGTALVAAGLLAWLFIVFLLAQVGFTRQWNARPPHFAMLAVLCLVTANVLSRGRWFTRRLEAMPRWWPVALQTFRVPLELILLALSWQGQAPRALTFEGSNLDIAVGLTAIPVALLMSRGRMSTRATMAWNVFGLTLLANIVFRAVTHVPGPFQLPWNDGVFTIIADAPFVLLPTFLVPVAAFGHITSIRQTLRMPGCRLAARRLIPTSGVR